MGPEMNAMKNLCGTTSPRAGGSAVMRPGRVGSSPLRSPTRETRVPVATLPKESKLRLINHLQGQTYFRKQKAQL